MLGYGEKCSAVDVQSECPRKQIMVEASTRFIDKAAYHDDNTLSELKVLDQ